MMAAEKKTGFKSIDSVMKMSALRFAERMIRKRYPDLAEKEFEIRQVGIPCKECQRGFYIQKFKRRSCNLVAQYQIQLQGRDDWRPVPMPEMICTDCTDNKMGMEAWENHKRMEIRRKTDHLWIINEELETANLSNYEPADKSTAEALKISFQYLDDFANGFPDDAKKTLIFRGTYGAGKSHLLKAIAESIKNDLRKPNGDPFTVGFIPMEDVLTMIKGTWGKDGDTHNEHTIIRDLIDLDFLVLDDVGSEGGEWAGKKLFEIINGRMGKPTGITTNYTEWDRLADRLGENGGKIVSRMRSKAKVFDIETTDKRIED